jgi:2'-5' RNA ligase
MGEIIEGFRSADFGDWRVERVDFMQSVLSPKGAKYTLLKSFNLEVSAYGG